MSGRKTLYPETLLFLLFLQCFIVFWQTLEYDFIKFDDPLIFENPIINQGLTLDSLKLAFKINYGNWIPLSWLSHIIDFQFFGVNPAGHHFSNILIHSFSTIILFLTLYSLTNKILSSFFVASLFGIHPLHVESVAWISERKDVLSALFYCLTIWSYVIYSKNQTNKNWFFVLLFCLLGLMAKPTLVTLPFLLLLLDFWPLKRITFQNSFKFKSFGFLIMEKKSLFLFSIIFCLITLNAQKESKNFLDT